MIRSRFLPVAVVALAAAPATLAHNRVDAPNGGESFQVGEVTTVQWTITVPHAIVGWDVEYSVTGNQGPWLPIALSLPPGDMSGGAVHTIDWLVPDTVTSSARVRVVMRGAAMTWEDTSDSNFTIAPSLGTRGCAGQAANSSGDAARIDALGSASVADDSLSLAVSGLPSMALGYALNARVTGFAANPGGSQGNLCLGGAIGRHALQVSNSGPLGRVVVPIDLGQLPRPTGSAVVLAGETWSFQYWTRDANPTPTSNFSDTVSVTFS